MQVFLVSSLLILAITNNFLAKKIEEEDTPERILKKEIKAKERQAMYNAAMGEAIKEKNKQVNIKYAKEVEENDVLKDKHITNRNEEVKKAGDKMYIFGLDVDATLLNTNFSGIFVYRDKLIREIEA